MTWLLWIAFVLGATSRPTLADPAAPGEPYRTQIIPTCERYVLLAGGEVCGYRDLEQWKALARADAELVLCRATEPQVLAAVDALSAEAAALKSALDHESRALGIALADRTRLREELLAKDKELQDERVKPRIGGSRVPWVIAAGLAVALGTTVTVAVLH